MKKNLGVVQAVYPMPVLMVAAYDENGKVDVTRLNALIFDQFQHGYYVSGEKVGQAWNAGMGLMKK